MDPRYDSWTCTSHGSKIWYCEFGIANAANPDGLSPFSLCWMSASQYTYQDDVPGNVPFIGDADIYITNVSPSTDGNLYFRLNVDWPDDLEIQVVTLVYNPNRVVEEKFFSRQQTLQRPSGVVGSRPMKKL